MPRQTRQTRNIIAPKLEEEVEKVVGEETEDDDSCPPVLDRKAPIRGSEGSKKEAGPVNLAQALLNLFTESENSGQASFDPFPADFGKGLVLPETSNPNVLLPARSNAMSQLASVLKPGAAYQRRYGLQPPKPHPSKIVGSNNSPGPMKILEVRKMELEAGKRRGDRIMEQHRSLLQHNGKRPVQQFRRPCTSSGPSSLAGPSTPNTDIVSMLHNQPPVEMDVSVRGVIQETEARKPIQGEMCTPIQPILDFHLKGASLQNVILGAKVLDALKILQSRGQDEYHQFQTELFGLVLKYNLH